jgi:threonine dehydrogenase-like Zn-dependent dehydrogenase
MKAFIMKEVGVIGVIDKPKPVLTNSYDAIIRTTTGMVCTSDVHTVKGAIGDKHNITLGHEACGIVEEVGSEVRNFKPGDRVVVNAITPCYQCENCQRGFTSQCGEMLGGWKFANIKDGCFAEYFSVNYADANLTKIPYSISDECAIYTADMMPTGFGCAENGNIPIGGTVAVFGVGPVGLMAVAAARLLGAAIIIAVDKIPQRLEVAKEYGADFAINFNETDPVQAILDLTEKQGVDAALECVGDSKAFEWCVESTRPGGVISNAGYHSDDDFVGIPRLAWGTGMSDKTIRTLLCPGGKERMSRLLRLIDNDRVNPMMLTTHRFDSSEIEEAFNVMVSKEDNVIKPIVMFSE